MKRLRGLRGRALSRRWGAVIVGVLGVALAAYALLHSPLRPFLNDLIGAQGRCWVFCGREAVLSMADRASVGLLIVVAVLAACASVASLRLRGFERIPASGLLSLAFLSVPAALVAGLGDVVGVGLLRPPVGPVLAAIPGIAVLAWSIRRGWRPPWPDGARPPLTPLTIVVGAVAAGLLVLSAAVGMSHPPTGFDELGYHAPLGVLLWRDGLLSTPVDWFPSSFALAQPGTAELWHGALRILGGESLANLGQLPFALLGAAGVNAFARRLGLSRRAALVAGTCFLVAPMLVIQIGRQANDVTAASILIALAALAAAPLREWTPGRVALIGLGLGVLTATKLALLPGVAAIGVVLVVTVVLLWRRDRGQDPAPDPGDAGDPRHGAEPSRLPRRAIGVGVAAGVGLFVLTVAPWWIRNLIDFGNPLYPAAVPFFHGVSQPRLGALDFSHVPSRLLWPFYPLLEPHANSSGFGAPFAIAFVPGLVIAALRGVRRPLLILAAVAAFSLPAWWLFTRHEPRFLLGLAALVFATLPFALAALARRDWQRAAAGLLCAAALLSAGVTLTTELATDSAHPVDRVTFYEDVWRIDPAVQQLPDSEGVLLDDSCRAGFGDRLYPHLAASGERRVARIACGATPDGVVAALKRYHLHTVYAVVAVTRSATLDARYPADRFSLVSRSVAADPKAAGRQIDRRIYRLLPAP